MGSTWSKWRPLAIAIFRVGKAGVSPGFTLEVLSLHQSHIAMKKGRFVSSVATLIILIAVDLWK